MLTLNPNVQDTLSGGLNSRANAFLLRPRGVGCGQRASAFILFQLSGQERKDGRVPGADTSRLLSQESRPSARCKAWGTDKAPQHEPTWDPRASPGKTLQMKESPTCR